MGSDQDACRSWASHLFAIYWRITQQHFQLGRNGLDSDLMARGCQPLDKLRYAAKLIGAQLHHDIAIARAVVHGLPLLAVRLVQLPARAIVVRP